MDNGLVIDNSIFIPREILVHILRFVHPYTLVNSCTKVCQSWNEIISNDVWRSLLNSFNVKPGGQWQPMQVKYPYPFGRNLLLNNCAQDGLKHWSIKMPEFPEEYLNERCGWWVENIPSGADRLPKRTQDFGGLLSCFSSSFQKCEKEQEIDLIQNGFSGYIMDVWQPKIIVSEWFAGRYDCGCWYKLKAVLLDKDRHILCQRRIDRKVKQWKGKRWHKVIITFENYGPGVRFIVFNHAGQDTKFWAGQFGSKMSGGVVKFSLPKPTEN